MLRVFEWLGRLGRSRKTLTPAETEFMRALFLRTFATGPTVLVEVSTSHGTPEAWRSLERKGVCKVRSGASRDYRVTLTGAGLALVRGMVASSNRAEP